MKKIVTITVIALITFACSHTMQPTTTETKKTTTTETTDTQTKIKDETVVAPTAADAAHADMATAGKTIYTTRCAKCHAAKDVTAYTSERWDGILKSMIPKAHLNDDEAKQVTAYVKANAKQ